MYENAGYFQMYRWVTSAPFFQRRERGILDNPQTIEGKLKSAEAKLKVAEEKLAVVDLFIKASYEAAEWDFKGHHISVQRGDVVTAQSALAQQWGWRTKSGWDAKRVARFLEELEAEGWIKIKPVLKSHTIISILIYVPAPQDAKDPGTELAKNLPKNQDGKSLVNTGNFGEDGGGSAKDSAEESAEILPLSNKNNKENNIITSKDDVADDEKKTDDDCSGNEKKDKTSLHLEEKSNQVKSSHQKKSKSKSSVPQTAPAPTGGTLVFEYYRSKLLKEHGIKHLKEAADGTAGKKIFEYFNDIEKAKEYIDFAFKDKWVAEKEFKFTCFMSNFLFNDFELLKKAPQRKIDFKSLEDFDNSFNSRQKQQPKKQITSIDDL